MLIGLRLTLKHFFIAIGFKRKLQVGVMDASYFMHKDGIVTNLYPHESIPVPDNGRYRLHNEIEDCIVCDLCAKVCPVNCIDIEPIKSPVEITKTSDGSPKRIYAAVFDIDMAKCCYCGLCTTVCPTESLTMTKTYDFSEYNVSNMIYHFAELSPAQGVLKREEMEALAAEEKAKKAAAAASKIGESTEGGEKPVTAKPAFKPKVAMPSIKKPSTEEITDNTADSISSSSEVESSEVPTEKPTVSKPVFKPKVMIPMVKKIESEESKNEVEKSKDEVQSSTSEGVTSKPQAKPVMRSLIPKVPSTEVTDTLNSDSKLENIRTEEPTNSSVEEVIPVAKLKPIMKPIIPKVSSAETPGEQIIDKQGHSAEEQISASEVEVKPAAKPKPIMKPIIPKKTDEGGEPNA